MLQNFMEVFFIFFTLYVRIFVEELYNYCCYICFTNYRYQVIFFNGQLNLNFYEESISYCCIKNFIEKN